MKFATNNISPVQQHAYLYSRNKQVNYDLQNNITFMCVQDHLAYWHNLFVLVNNDHCK